MFSGFAGLAPDGYYACPPSMPRLISVPPHDVRPLSEEPLGLGADLLFVDDDSDGSPVHSSCEATERPGAAGMRLTSCVVAERS